MVKTSVSLEEAIQFLASLVDIDQQAMQALVAARVSCGDDLANHPTVQVCHEGGYYRVGLLGIINGLFGIHADGLGPIGAVYDGGTLIGFTRVKGRDA